MGIRFQDRVWQWALSCFGPVIPVDKIERGDRVAEEVLELLQAAGYPEERFDALKRYVYDRPVGELFQEAGGVMVTLAAFSQAHDIDLYEAGETELERVWAKIEQIRAKQAAKPVGSALPGYAQPVLRSDALDPIMDQVQVFASTYALVGGSFDDGSRMEQSNEAKAALRAMIARALGREI